MKISLENIGLLKNAQVNWDKDIIVVAGPNNSGKTYLTYSLYGTLRFLSFPEYWDRMFNEISLDNLSGKEIKQGKSILDINVSVLSNEINEKFTNFLSNENLSATILAQTFGVNANTYANSKITLDFGVEDIENSIHNTFRTINGESKHFEMVGFGGTKALITHPEKTIIRVKIDNWDDAPTIVLAERIREFIVGFLSSYIPENLLTAYTFFATSERNSIDLFSKEIITSRLIRVDRRGRERMANGLESSSLALEDYVYSLPIQNSLLFADNLSEYAKRQGPLHALAEEIESELLHGSMQVDSIGSISFTPNASSVQISLQLSSSIVKSLASLVFFCRHLARPGMTLFVDEPEMNLHPDNQRKIAKALVKLANSGIKVIISTHSDYILLELNNMIMLGESNSEGTRDGLMKKYDYDSMHLLTKKDIGVYFCNINGVVTELEVSATGFEVESIEKEINELNSSAAEIFFELYGE